MSKYSTSLFIFRRGLRVRDNTGLISALEKSKQVIPAFIFTPEQIEGNEYKSEPAVQFMIESLEDLENQLENRDGKLYKFFGKPHDIVEKINDEVSLDTVFLNRDYTPYSKKRDQKIKDICEDDNVDFRQKNDYLLLEPEKIKTNKGTPYQVFTPFFNKAKDKPIDKPQDNNRTNYYTDKISFAKPNIYQEILQERNDSLFKTGGRAEAEKIIRNLHNYEDYETEREIPSQDGTTGLSAYNKFGTVSIREVYWNIRNQLSKDYNLIQELFWRDFYTHIAFHKPEVFGEPFKNKYQDLEWEHDEEHKS